MDYFRRFTFLLCAPAFDADELEGERLKGREISQEEIQAALTRKLSEAETHSYLEKPNQFSGAGNVRPVTSST